jgi:hypothetical protein
MYQITDMLSTHGIGVDTEEEFRKKLPKLWMKDKDMKMIDKDDNNPYGYTPEHSYPYDAARQWKILDVRKLNDDGSNKLMDYARLIMVGRHYISHNDHVIVCCHVGHSRSNAIAVGILTECGARYDLTPMNFFDACNLVVNKVPVCNIDPSHISKLKKLFGVYLP